MFILNLLCPECCWIWFTPYLSNSRSCVHVSGRSVHTCDRKVMRLNSAAYGPRVGSSDDKEVKDLTPLLLIDMAHKITLVANTCSKCARHNFFWSNYYELYCVLWTLKSVVIQCCPCPFHCSKTSKTLTAWRFQRYNYQRPWYTFLYSFRFAYIVSKVSYDIMHIIAELLQRISNCL